MKQFKHGRTRMVVALALSGALALAATSAPAQDPVLVPPLPLLAPVAKGDPGGDLRALRDAAVPPPPAATDPAEAPGAPGQTAQDATPAEAGAAPAAPDPAQALDRMDPDMLQILSGMSAEELQALTRLIRAQAPDTAGPAPEGANTPPAGTTEGTAAPDGTTGVLIQAGSFRSSDNARDGARRIAAQGVAATVRPTRDGAWFRLLAGPLPAEETDLALELLAGLGYPDAFVLPQAVPLGPAR